MTASKNMGSVTEAVQTYKQLTRNEAHNRTGGFLEQKLHRLILSMTTEDFSEYVNRTMAFDAKMNGAADDSE